MEMGVGGRQEDMCAERVPFPGPFAPPRCEGVLMDGWRWSGRGPGSRQLPANTYTTTRLN